MTSLRFKTRLLKQIERAESIPDGVLVTDHGGDWWVRNGDVLTYLAPGGAEAAQTVVDAFGPMRLLGFTMPESYGAALDALVTVAECEEFTADHRAMIYEAIAVLFPGST